MFPDALLVGLVDGIDLFRVEVGRVVLPVLLEDIRGHPDLEVLLPSASEAAVDLVDFLDESGGWDGRGISPTCLLNQPLSQRSKVRNEPSARWTGSSWGPAAVVVLADLIDAGLSEKIPPLLLAAASR